jgi:hypothetical protein
MIFTGEAAHASGWLGRARSLLAERGADCVEWGFLQVPRGVDQLMGGDADAASNTFSEALAIGRRFANQDLLAMAGPALVARSSSSDAAARAWRSSTRS